MLVGWLVGAVWVLAATSGTVAVGVGCRRRVGEIAVVGDAVGSPAMGVSSDRGDGVAVGEKVGVGLTGAKRAVGEGIAKANAVGSGVSRPGLPQPINVAIKANASRSTGKRRIDFMR